MIHFINSAVAFFLISIVSSSLCASDFDNFIQVQPPVKHLSQINVEGPKKIWQPRYLLRKISEEGCAFCCAKMVIKQRKLKDLKKSHFKLLENARLHLHFNDDLILMPLTVHEIVERHTGYVCDEHWGRLSFFEIASHINNNRPIIISYDWLFSEFGHSMTISGYYYAKGQQLILLNDPARKHPVAVSYYNLRTGRYADDIPEQDLVEDMETEILADWNTSTVLSNTTFGAFSSENKENIANNFPIIE